MTKCKICSDEAIYEEWSPDGPADYFCSQNHHMKYVKEQHSKGIVWRALPLGRIK